MTKSKLLKRAVLLAAILLLAAAGVCIWAAERPDYPPVVRLWDALYCEDPFYFSDDNVITVENVENVWPVEPELRITDVCSSKLLPESNGTVNRTELLGWKVVLRQKVPTESFSQMLPAAIGLYDEEAGLLHRFRLYDPIGNRSASDALSVLNGNTYETLYPLGPAAAEVMEYYSFAPTEARFTSCWQDKYPSGLYVGRHPTLPDGENLNHGTLPEGGTVNEAFLNKPLYATPYSDDLIIELSPGEYYFLPTFRFGYFGGLVSVGERIYRVTPAAYTWEQLNFFQGKYKWAPTEETVTDATWKANIGSRIWKGSVGTIALMEWRGEDGELYYTPLSIWHDTSGTSLNQPDPDPKTGESFPVPKTNGE